MIHFCISCQLFKLAHKCCGSIFARFISALPLREFQGSTCLQVDRHELERRLKGRVLELRCLDVCPKSDNRSGRGTCEDLKGFFLDKLRPTIFLWRQMAPNVKNAAKVKCKSSSLLKQVKAPPANQEAHQHTWSLTPFLVSHFAGL